MHVIVLEQAVRALIPPRPRPAQKPSVPARAKTGQLGGLEFYAAAVHYALLTLQHSESFF